MIKVGHPTTNHSATTMTSDWNPVGLGMVPMVIEQSGRGERAKRQRARGEQFGEGLHQNCVPTLNVNLLSSSPSILRIVWAKSSDAKEKLAALAMDGNKDKITSAPVVAIIGYDIDFHEELPWLFPHTDAKSWFEGDEEGRKEGAFRNSSLQGAYLMIAARALGLDCGPMSGFDNDKVDAEFFGDNPRHRSNFICAIGYGDRTSIFERSPRPEFDKFNRIA